MGHHARRRVIMATTGSADVQRSLEAAVAALAVDEAQVLQLEPDRLPRAATRHVRRLSRDFVHTPEPLLRAWRAARQLERAAHPGDLVVVSDHDGLGGLFALEQSTAPPDERRTVVVVAGHSLTLDLLHLAGTAEGPEDEAAAVIDWELVGYRSAAAVLTASDRARALLALAGFSAQRIPLAPTTAPSLTVPPAVIGAPEPVSRSARTPEILRAVAAARIAGSNVRAYLSTEDRDDRTWTGTTWEALAGLRATLGDAIERTTEPGPADAIVLGDPFALPLPSAEAVVSAGTPPIVPAGSAAAARWPGAATWEDEHDLAQLLATGAWGAGAALAPPTTPTLDRPATQPERARRVSVAVPVFRDVRYLDACLRSIVDQEQPPHEIVLVDDGSGSGDVDRALDDWTSRHAGLVRALRQPNRGVCAARNLALDHLTGDAFILVDQDDELEPTFIARCAAALRGDAALTAVATWTRFVGDYEGVEAKPPFDARVGRRENPIVSTCVLVDMAVRDAGIRFAPDLAWVYCEDWDLWARIVAAGGRFGLVPEPLVRHRVHTGSGGHRRTPLALQLGRARATSHLQGRITLR